MKSIVSFAAGLAIASSSAAQLLGIGAGAGARADLDVGGLVSGAVRAVSGTAANAGAGLSADVRGEASVPAPAARVRADASMEAERAPARQGTWAGSTDGAAAVRTESRTDVEGAMGSGAATSPPRSAQMQPKPHVKAVGQASGAIDVNAGVPRVGLDAGSRTQVRGGVLAPR